MYKRSNRMSIWLGKLRLVHLVLKFMLKRSDSIKMSKFLIGDPKYKAPRSHSKVKTKKKSINCPYDWWMPTVSNKE